MQIAVFVGGNKQHTAARLGVETARRLQAAGKTVTLWGVKGTLPNAGPVALKEYSASTTAKTLAAALIKDGTACVISLMDLRACEAAVQAKRPFVYVEYDGFKEDKPVRTKKALLKKAAHVLVLCDGEKPLSKRVYAGLPAVRVTAPVLGVTHGSWGRPAAFKKENNILAIGSFGKESRFEKLLEIWAKLSPLHPSWQLTLAGDGAGKAALTRAIAKYNLQGSTQLVSASAGVEALLAQADIFACVGTTGRAGELADAMASKLPCIALKSEAAENWIADGVNGVLAKDEADFVRTLDHLMVDWGYRVGLAVNAAQLQQQYTPDAFARAVWETLARE